MQVLILAAGYATRLYPLTLHRPKPLLFVGGKPMIEHLIDHLEGIEEVEDIFLVTNQKFFNPFSEWKEQYQQKQTRPFPIQIINDGSTSDEDKLGAIGDIALVLQKENIRDLMVIAGDNLFTHSLESFAAYALEKQEAILGVYDVGDLEAMKKYSAISIDTSQKITFFEEKPKDPKTSLAGIALYYYPERILKEMATYINEGNHPDQPGRFVQWLYSRYPVYAFEIEGTWFDIGSKETLQEADEFFTKLSC